MTVPELIKAAIKAREHSYSPYSHFKVGAALLVKSGKLYTGCNVECAAYSPTNCAERTAFFKAVSEGEKEFDSIAVVGGYDDKPLELCPPCGVCRQVMAEFCHPEFFRIICAKSENDYAVYTLRELLPESFGPSNLK